MVAINCSECACGHIDLIHKVIHTKTVPYFGACEERECECKQFQPKDIDHES